MQTINKNLKATQYNTKYNKRKHFLFCFFLCVFYLCLFLLFNFKIGFLLFKAAAKAKEQNRTIVGMYVQHFIEQAKGKMSKATADYLTPLAPLRDIGKKFIPVAAENPIDEKTLGPVELNKLRQKCPFTKQFKKASKEIETETGNIQDRLYDRENKLLEKFERTGQVPSGVEVHNHNSNFKFKMIQVQP